MFCISDNQLSENKKLIINYPDEFKNNEFDEDKIPFNGHPNVTKSHPKISCKYHFLHISNRADLSYCYDNSL